MSSFSRRPYVSIAPHLYRFLDAEGGYAVRVRAVDPETGRERVETQYLPRNVGGDDDARRICRTMWQDALKGCFSKDRDYTGRGAPTLLDLRDQIAAELRLFGRRESTIRHFLFVTEHLIPRFGHMTVTEIDHADARGFWTELVKRRDLNPGTKNRIRAELRRLLDIAVGRGFRATNAARALTPLISDPGADRPPPSLEELAPAFALWDGIDRARCNGQARTRQPYMGHGVYFRLQIALLSRGQEVCSLRWSDIDPRERVVTIRPEVEKERKTRRAMLSEGMLGMLETHASRLDP